MGNRTKVKVVKNKIAPPFKEAEFDIIYGIGISREGDILDLAASVDIIRKSGSWYSYEGMKLAQGRESAKDYLKSHPDFMEQIEQKVREHFHLQSDGTVAVEIPVLDENYEEISESFLQELEKDDVITLEEYAQEQ